MKKELILTFDADVINQEFEEGLNIIMRPHTPEDVERIFNSAYQFQPRYKAEESNTTRHPIPYVVLVSSAPGDRPDEVYLYRRGKGVGEQRLAGAASCGVGGHVDLDWEWGTDTNIVNGTSFDPMAAIWQAAEREIEEEMGVKINLTSKTSDSGFIHGILLDNSNEVGKVHVGIVIVRILSDDEREMLSAGVTETELFTIGWESIDELDTNCEELGLENWSKIVIDSFKSLEPLIKD